MNIAKKFGRSLSWWPLLLLGISAGCGHPNDTPPLGKVEGQVLLDGQPLTRGSVQFSPDRDKGTSGRMAIGAIGPDGKFTLTTITDGDGAQIGFHKVAVQSFEDPGAIDPKNTSPAPLKLLIPKKYVDPETSGLTAEVKKANAPLIIELHQTGK